MAQWFMAALVRHPGFESRICCFFALLLSLPAGSIPLSICIILILCEENKALRFQHHSGSIQQLHASV